MVGWKRKIMSLGLKNVHPSSEYNLLKTGLVVLF